jgi:putative SOS response-associated peptidase YedK
MCYHKSLVAKYEALMEHYSASFAAVTAELELIEERFANLKSRNQDDQPYSKEEISELKWSEKALQSFGAAGYKRYHENGFDYLPTPIITAGAPEELKLMRWGLIPFYMKEKAKAFALRPSTLNCISEEMFEKPSFRDAVKNGQRCLIPTTGFYEWHWNDEKGKTKIPYFVSLKDEPIASIAGLYSRWKDTETGQYQFTYTVLTTAANSLMSHIHNSKKRMPVIIPRQYEKDWLNKDLSKDDVLALCQPFNDEQMKAYTISKLITTKDADTNVSAVMEEQAYEEVVDLPDFEKKSSK